MVLFLKLTMGLLLYYFFFFLVLNFLQNKKLRVMYLNCFNLIKFNLNNKMIVFFSVEKSFNIIMYFFLKLKIFKTKKTATFYTQSISLHRIIKFKFKTKILSNKNSEVFQIVFRTNKMFIIKSIWMLIRSKLIYTISRFVLILKASLVYYRIVLLIYFHQITENRKGL